MPIEFSKFRGPDFGVHYTYYPPQLTNDGTKPIYRVDAHYVYALNRPPLKTEPIAVGVLPYTSYPASEMVVKRDTLYGLDGQAVSPSQTSGGK